VAQQCSFVVLMHSGVNLTGILGDAGADTAGLIKGMCGGIFHLKWRLLVNFERHFCSCPRQKNVEFPPKLYIVGHLRCTMGSSEYVVKKYEVGKLLLHCNLSNLAL